MRGRMALPNRVGAWKYGDSRSCVPWMILVNCTTLKASAIWCSKLESFAVFHGEIAIWERRSRGD